jgi:hypothetical protein
VHVCGHVGCVHSASANGFPCTFEIKMKIQFLVFWHLNLASINIFVLARSVVQNGASISKKLQV